MKSPIPARPAARAAARARHAGSHGRTAQGLLVASLLVLSCNADSRPSPARLGSNLLFSNASEELVDNRSLVTLTEFLELDLAAAGSRDGIVLKSGARSDVGFCDRQLVAFEMALPRPMPFSSSWAIDLRVTGQRGFSVSAQWQDAAGRGLAEPVRKGRLRAEGERRDRFQLTLGQRPEAARQLEIRSLARSDSGICMQHVALLAEQPGAKVPDRLDRRAAKIAIGGVLREAILLEAGRQLPEIELACGDLPVTLIAGRLDSGQESARLELWLEADQRPPMLAAAMDFQPGEASAWQTVRSQPSTQQPTSECRLTVRSVGTTLAAGAPMTPVLAVASLTPKASPPPADRPPNVILISLDTLRADRMSLYGHRRNTTPRLDLWAARRGVAFEQAFVQGTTTLPSHYSLLTGQEVYRHGVIYPDSSAWPRDTLPLRLRAAGYSTLAVTGSGFMHPRYGFARSFQLFDFRVDDQGSSEASSAVTRAIDAIRSASEPFFLLLHTYEVHARRSRREPYYSQFAMDGLDSGDQGPVGEAERAAYDSGIAETDQRIGDLLAYLDGRGLLERSLVIVTSDHGEMLGEHDVIGHGYLYEQNLHVPLVISFPDGRYAGRRVAPIVRQIDLAPTVLDLVDLDPPRDRRGYGRSLLPLLDGRDLAPRPAAAYSGRFGLALRTGEATLFHYADAVAPPDTSRTRLFNAMDRPLESRNLAATGPDRVEVLAAEVRSRLALAPGLRIEISANPLAGSVLELSADWLVDGRTKWLSRPLESARFDDSGTLHIPLQGQQEGLLVAHIDTPPESPLEIQIAAGDAVVADLLDISALRRGRSVQKILHDPASGLSIRIGVSWRGALAVANGRAGLDSGDRALEERLRQLGYLD